MSFVHLLFLISIFFSFEDKKLPPGTVLIKGYYIDVTEISNVSWLLYEFETGRQGNENRTTKPKYNFDYNHPDHRNLPITNITYEQAEMYCKWRSQVVSKRLKKKVTYRLPTQDEWREIAEELLKKYPNQMMPEYDVAKTILPKPGTLLALANPTTDYPTKFFSGVSEMTATKGVAMGLNDDNLTQWEENLIPAFNYNEYSELLGFRCIAEVEEKKAKQRK